VSRRKAYPSAESKVNFRVESFHLAALDVDRLEPSDNAWEFPGKFGIRLEIIRLYAESLKCCCDIFLSPCFEVPEVVQTSQGLGEIDFFQLGSETTSQERSDEARR
jgi:hypothetical protein